MLGIALERFLHFGVQKNIFSRLPLHADLLAQPPGVGLQGRRSQRVPGSRVCIAVTPTVLAVRPTFSVARDHSPSDEQPDPTEPAGHQAGRYRTTSCFPSLDRCELRSVIVLMLRVWFENTTTWCCCVVDSG